MHISNYCMVSIPVEYQRPTDFVLAGVLMGGSVGLASQVTQINEWLALAGGLIGVTIGVARLCEMVWGWYKKPKE